MCSAWKKFRYTKPLYNPLASLHERSFDTWWNTLSPSCLSFGFLPKSRIASLAIVKSLNLPIVALCMIMFHRLHSCPCVNHHKTHAQRKVSRCTQNKSSLTLHIEEVMYILLGDCLISKQTFTIPPVTSFRKKDHWNLDLLIMRNHVLLSPRSPKPTPRIINQCVIKFTRSEEVFTFKQKCVTFSCGRSLRLGYITILSHGRSSRLGYITI